MFGQECRYPIDLLLPKAPGHVIANYEFTRWLNEQFMEAHMNAKETLRYRQGRQKRFVPEKRLWRGTKAKRESLASCTPKTKSRKFFFPWIGPYKVIERTSEVNQKFSKGTNSKKWQIVHYNQLKPVKEEDELHRMETRSSDQEKWPNLQNTYDEEVHIEENNKNFTPEITSRRPKQERPFKGMDEDEEFFYDLFAEHEHSTKRPTKTNIPAEPITPEQKKPKRTRPLL